MIEDNKSSKLTKANIKKAFEKNRGGKFIKNIIKFIKPPLFSPLLFS